MSDDGAGDPIVIVGAARTPMGGLLGDLSAVKATDLGATAIKAALSRAQVKSDEVDEVLMGCVLPAGLGQAPARQAALAAGVPESVPCTTVNKMCGSGMMTVMMAHDALALGRTDIMVAGGMESMTNAPYILPHAREGLRLGHTDFKDHMYIDGLEDPFEGKLMGCYAEDTATRYQFTREAQDAFAIESLTRAIKAQESGAFDDEIIPVTFKARKGETTVARDEQPPKADTSKIPKLKPVFVKDGTVTPANASSISDGGAALVLMRRSEADARGLKPLATIRGHATFAQEPRWFTTAPVGAVNALLEQLGWGMADVDLFELNEAFAVVTMAAMRDLDIPHDKVNIHGGACALGHPVGCSGARIIVTLLHAMERNDLSRGVASLCLAGGEATAIAVERMN